MDVRGEEPYFVACFVFDTLVFCIVILGLLILSDFNELNEVFVEVLEALGHVLGRGDRILVELFKVDGELGVVTVIGIERGTSNTRMLSIVVREFGKG